MDINLIIALEPEAASLHCHQVKGLRFSGVELEKPVLEPGDKYLVVDAGGEITKHHTTSYSTVFNAAMDTKIFSSAI